MYDVIGVIGGAIAIVLSLLPFVLAYYIFSKM
jgi:hypothetical protein